MSELMACAACPLAVEELDSGHSLAMCSTDPQKMQRLLSKYHCLSKTVSFLSLLSLLESAVFFRVVVGVEVEGFEGD